MSSRHQLHGKTKRVACLMGGGGGGGGGRVRTPFLIKVTGVLIGKFENTPKRYQNLVLWVCPKFISTPKRYQFNNNK